MTYKVITKWISTSQLTANADCTRGQLFYILDLCTSPQSASKPKVFYGFVEWVAGICYMVSVGVPR